MELAMSSPISSIYNSPEGPSYTPASAETQDKTVIYHGHMRFEEFERRRDTLDNCEIFDQLTHLGSCIYYFKNCKAVKQDSNRIKVAACKDSTFQEILHRYLQQRLIQPASSAPSGGPICPLTVPKGGPISSSSSAESSSSNGGPILGPPTIEKGGPTSSSSSAQLPWWSPSRGSAASDPMGYDGF